MSGFWNSSKVNKVPIKIRGSVFNLNKKIMKAIVIILVLLIAIAIIYFTFIIAAIEFAFGAVMLGIMVLSLLAAWILWKKRRS